ncbi:MAG: exodeoxyribonuclease VII large subunit [Deltaproteobacteria bacterium]|nr:exodeoxyribonuclease VII large subunit [Deltaproteobacteria bacterium]
MLGVAELDRALKRLLEASTADVRVRGEISDLHLASSGHAYFSLKDESEPALIECVMYRTAPARARRLLVEGASVVLRGRVTVYPPRGRMQLVAEDVLGTARGAQLEALERLKAKLATEGLFAPERKRPLPAEPRLVAVLTSRDGAAIHDVVRVAFRRGRVRVLLVPTPVQGAEAAEPIAAAVRLADGLGADVMIVTRGGGSLDDLAAYNDERVVRAVAAARTVVVSAVGHEIDTTLCDLASDARAATPSQAAELVVPDQAERLAALASLGSRLAGAMRHRLTSGRERLTRLRAGLGEPRRRVLEEAQRWDELGARLERAMRLRLRRHRSALDEGRRRLGARHPRAVLAAARARLGPLDPRLRAAVQRRLQALRHELGAGTARLDALSPLGVLGRGYAIATSEDGRVLRDAGEVAAGDGVGVRLHRGRLETRVERAVKG